MTAPKPTPAVYQQILACRMGDNDARAETVGQYLGALSRMVWEYEQSFDGKRPFGNSSWQWEVYEALGKAGIIEVTYDKWEEPQLADRDEVDGLIYGAITHAFLEGGTER